MSCSGKETGCTKHYGLLDKSLSEQQICGNMSISFIMRQNWACPPTAIMSYGWQAGRQADEMWIDFEFFKIPCRLNYSDFYSI